MKKNIECIGNREGEGMSRGRNHMNYYSESVYKFWDSFWPGVGLSILQMEFQKNNHTLFLPIIISLVILLESGIDKGLLEGRIIKVLWRVYLGVLVIQLIRIIVEMLLIYNYDQCVYPTDYILKPECWLRGYISAFPRIMY